MSAASSTSDDTGITTICENGDVLLLVGRKETEILVSLDFLKQISFVFKVMLKGPKVQGEALQNATPGSPIMLTLPDECPKVVKHVLRILYGANDDFESTPSFETVCAMVAFANYYDMGNRLDFWAAQWLRISPFDEDDGPDMRECFEKMVIAYMSRDHHSFFQTSHYLATYGGGIIHWGLDFPAKEDFPPDDKKFPDKELGIKLALAIEEMRPVPKHRAPLGKGLCIDCFDNAKGSFLSKQDGCDNDMYHCIEEDDQLEV